MGKVAIYPGSFDPITYGHLDLIKRATRIFSKVTVAVAINTQKKPLFNIDERVEMITAATKNLRGITIETFDGLIIDYARKKKINVLIRGLRMISDFEYELQMALRNRRLAGDIETIFLMPSEGYSFLSSTLLKEAASFGADISTFVPKFVAQKIKAKLSR